MQSHLFVFETLSLKLVLAGCCFHFTSLGNSFNKIDLIIVNRASFSRRFWNWNQSRNLIFAEIIFTLRVRAEKMWSVKLSKHLLGIGASWTEFLLSHVHCFFVFFSNKRELLEIQFKALLLHDEVLIMKCVNFTQRFLFRLRAALITTKIKCLFLDEKRSREAWSQFNKLTNN